MRASLLSGAVIAAAVAAAGAWAQSQASSVFGDWKTEGGWATVHIGPCPDASDRVCGTISGLRHPNGPDGHPQLDVSNPDPALRSRPLVGLPFLTHFRGASPGRWTDGEIYDPDSGRTYSSNMRLKADGSLEVNGCIWFFCQPQTWTRS